MNELFGWRFPLGDWAADFISWLTRTFQPVWDFIREFLLSTYNGLTEALTTAPSLAMIVLFAVLAGLAGGWPRGLIYAPLTGAGLVVIDLLEQWDNAMQTLAMVLIASVIAVLFAVPIGIAAARSTVVSGFTKPVLDLMQTMPPLVYLVPAIIMFRIGVVPGIVATIVFAMPPGIRLTELGIRQVDAEVVEAGHAFGSRPGAILRQVQLPLALPTIMAGVNQVIMLAFSMVVLAGIVGAPGLGQAVLEAINRINVGLGFEAGLSVVILAIILDRMTASMGARSTVARLQRAA